MIDYSPMKLKQDTPKVGVAVFIEKDGKILMMLRKGSHGEGTWSLPGGHIDVGESFFTTCAREVEEEVGMQIKSIEKFDFVEAFFEEGLHYVTLYFKADWEKHQTYKIMEEDKIEKLEWIDPNHAPTPLFSNGLRKMIKEYAKEQQTKQNRMLQEVYWERG